MTIKDKITLILTLLMVIIITVIITLLSIETEKEQYYDYLKDNTALETNAKILAINNGIIYFKTTDGNIFNYTDYYYLSSTDMNKTVTILFDTNGTKEVKDDKILNFWID